MILKAGIGVLVLGAVVAAGVMMGGGSVNSRDIILAPADRGAMEAAVNATGKVVPAFEQTITSPIASRIVEVYAKSGDTLQVGTPLLLLDLESDERELESLLDQQSIKQLERQKERVNTATRLSDLEMQLKVKEMTVDRLRAAVDNERRLDSLGSGTGEKVRQAQLAYDTGRLELEQLRVQLDGERDLAQASEAVRDLDMNVFASTIASKRRTLEDARLLSPRSAVLTYIADEIGSPVAPGEKLAVIADLSHFKLEGQVADTYAGKLAAGQRVIVVLGKERIEGSVSAIRPSSAGGVVTFAVRINDEGASGLRPGLTADIYLLTAVKEDVVRIPRGTYYKGPGKYELWVEDSGENSIVRRSVTLGDGNSDFVEVVTGISPGERVVINGYAPETPRKSLKIKND